MQGHIHSRDRRGNLPLTPSISGKPPLWQQGAASSARQQPDASTLARQQRHARRCALLEERHRKEREIAHNLAPMSSSLSKQIAARCGSLGAQVEALSAQSEAVSARSKRTLAQSAAVAEQGALFIRRCRRHVSVVVSRNGSPPALTSHDEHTISSCASICTPPPARMPSSATPASSGQLNEPTSSVGTLAGRLVEPVTEQAHNDWLPPAFNSAPSRQRDIQKKVEEAVELLANQQVSPAWRRIAAIEKFTNVGDGDRMDAYTDALIREDKDLAELILDNLLRLMPDKIMLSRLHTQLGEALKAKARSATRSPSSPSPQ